MASTFLLWIAGCGDGSDPGARTVVPPAPEYLSAPDQTLPPGVVGEPYLANVEVTGGDPPYTWSFADPGGALPGGLALASDGTVAGTPTQAGSFTIALRADDAAGRTKRTLVSLDVVLEPDVVRCGETIRGEFGGSAFDIDGPDLDQTEDIAWLAVEHPHDGTTRLELVFDNTAVGTLYVERPSELLGSWEIEDHYVGHYLNPAYTEMTVAIDAGTDPSLSGFESETLVPLLFVGQAAGAWEMEVVCTDGPIFTNLLQYPTELGLELAYDWDVYGDNTDVRIFPLEPLPDWVVWDETAGTATGTALEPGGWEFTIVAETADGKRREERTAIGVYAVEDAPCGTTTTFTVEEGYFDGETYAYYDPRGYRVFRVPLDGVVASRIDLEVTGSDGHYLGLAMPDPQELKFYGGAERYYLPYETVTMQVDPRTYPAIRHYLATDELYVSAGTIGTWYDMALTVVCDDTPRPDLAGLPVLEAFVPVDQPLPVLGGAGPWSWDANDLPAGISLSGDGVLAGSTGALGTHAVDLEVTDKNGLAGADSYLLHVGEEAACSGYERIACGDSISGAFTEAYYTDGNGPASTRVFCAIDRGQSLGFEIYADEDSELRVDVADPGRTAEDLFVAGMGTYVAYVDEDTSEGVPIDPFSWPDGDDYLDLPVLLAIRAYVPGDWTVHLVCE